MASKLPFVQTERISETSRQMKVSTERKLKVACFISNIMAEDTKRLLITAQKKLSISFVFNNRKITSILYERRKPSSSPEMPKKFKIPILLLHFEVIHETIVATKKCLHVWQTFVTSRKIGQQYKSTFSNESLDDSELKVRPIALNAKKISPVLQ